MTRHIVRVDPSTLQVGDVVRFTGNGKGRGGHCNVTVRVDKINRKTFNATEVEGSYRPGTLWGIGLDTQLYKWVDD